MSSMKGGPTPSSPGPAATTGGGINSPQHVGTPVSRVVQALTPQERANYEMFFVQADADKDGLIGPSDAAWFLNLGLDKKTLSEVWALVDIERRGALGRDAFYCALRLIAQARLAQQASSATPHLHPRPLSLEAAASPNAPQFTHMPAEHTDELAGSSSWQINAQERTKFVDIFEKADDDRDGFVTAAQAIALFGRSGLDMEDLGKIWTLSDINKDQLLDREEFVIAMYLINTRLKGRPLPDTLPVSLRPPAPVQVAQKAAKASKPLPQLPPGSGSSPSTGASVLTPTLQSHPVHGSPEPVHTGPDEEWLLSGEERAKYEDIFQKADDDHDSFVTAEQARNLFGRSGLPMPDLAKIWTLSDSDKDNKLSKGEFVVAMFLINGRLKGRRLPDTLPATLASPTMTGASLLSAVPGSLLGGLSPPGSGAAPEIPSPSVPGSGFTTALPTPPSSQNAMLQTTQQKNEGLKAKLDEVKSLVQQQQIQKEDLEKQLSQEKKRNQELQSEIESEQTKHTQLTADISKLKADINAEKAQGVTLEESIAKERKRQAAAREQRDKLEKSLSDLNRQYQQQQDSFHQAEQQAAQAQRDVERAEEQIETLSGQVEALKQRRAALGQQLETLNNRLAQYQSQSQQLQDQAASLTQDIATLELSVKQAHAADKDKPFFSPFGSEEAKSPLPARISTPNSPATSPSPTGSGIVSRRDSQTGGGSKKLPPLPPKHGAKKPLPSSPASPPGSTSGGKPLSPATSPSSSLSSLPPLAPSAVADPFHDLFASPPSASISPPSFFPSATSGVPDLFAAINNQPQPPQPFAFPLATKEDPFGTSDDFFDQVRRGGYDPSETRYRFGSEPFDPATLLAGSNDSAGFLQASSPTATSPTTADFGNPSSSSSSSLLFGHQQQQGSGTPPGGGGGGGGHDDLNHFFTADDAFA